MPPRPGTSVSSLRIGPHPPRIFAARLAAFEVAPQGTQYVSRIECVGLIAIPGTLVAGPAAQKATRLASWRM